MRLSASRLQRRLVLVAFFLILGLVFFSFLLVYHAVKKELSSHLEADLVSSQLVFEKFLEERYHYLLAQGEVIANDPRFFASIAEQDRLTAEEEAHRFRNIVKSDLFAICDTAARLLASVAVLESDNLSNSDTLLIQSLCRSQPRGMLNISQTIYQVVRIPLLAAGEGMVGNLILGYTIDSALAQTLKDMTRSEVAFFLGNKLLASTLPPAAETKMAQNPPAAVDLPRVVETELKGETFLSLSQRLDFSITRKPVYYCLLRSRDAALKPVMKEILTRVFKSFFVIILLGSFVTILGTLFLSVRIGQRLEKLVAGAHQISSGNLDFALPPGPDDELGRLSEAFNHMRISLKNRLEELKEAHEAALRQERLGIIGRMASSIIHDFRGPMQIIQGSAELLSLPGAPEEKKRRHTQIIVQQVQRMADMTQELLDFAKGESRAKKQILAIEDLLTGLNFQADELCRNSLVKFRADLNKPFQLWADKEKLLRVLANLVKNAKEAMPAGGEIKVTAFLDGMEGVIQVADNGPGLPPELAGRLFEPFATFGKKGGTGLGLAMAKKIIEEHDGTLQCESEPGRGTTFTIRLPAGERVVLQTTGNVDTDKVVI